MSKYEMRIRPYLYIPSGGLVVELVLRDGNLYVQPEYQWDITITKKEESNGSEKENQNN